MSRPDPSRTLGGTALAWLVLATATGGAASAAWAVSGAGTTSGRAVALPAAPVAAVSGTTCTLLELRTTVSWTAVAGATSYTVLRDGAVLTTTSGTSTTDSVLLGSLSSFSYTVRATAPGGWQGPASAPAVASC